MAEARESILITRFLAWDRLRSTDGVPLGQGLYFGSCVLSSRYTLVRSSDGQEIDRIVL